MKQIKWKLLVYLDTEKTHLKQQNNKRGFAINKATKVMFLHYFQT